MPKGAKPNASKPDIQAQFQQRVKELWETHESEFMQILDDAESKKVNLTFKATLDFSETAAKLTTTVSFSQVVKDGREDTFEDPNQRALPIGESDGEGEQIELPKGKGRGAKPAKAGKGRGNSEFVPPAAELED